MIFSDEKIVICSISEAMTLIIDCHSPVLVKFIGEIAKEKVSFVTTEEIITKYFAIPINKKLALATFMPNSKVEVVYKTSDEYVVINMTHNDA